MATWKKIHPGGCLLMGITGGNFTTSEENQYWGCFASCHRLLKWVCFLECLSRCNWGHAYFNFSDYWRHFIKILQLHNRGMVWSYLAVMEPTLCLSSLMDISSCLKIAEHALILISFDPNNHWYRQTAIIITFSQQRWENWDLTTLNYLSKVIQSIIIEW